MAGEQLLTLDFDREQDEPMGLLTDEKLMVTRVQDGTIAEGKIQLGDIVRKVNGYLVKDKDHFFQLLQRCYPTQLTLIRNTGRAEEIVASQLPQNLEEMIQRHDGYEYQLVEVDCSKFPGKALGLSLATRARRVLVTGAKNGSISAAFFEASDRILIISGTPVSDQEVAKRLILNSGGKFQAIIERASSEAAKAEVKKLEDAYRQAATAARATQQTSARSDMPQDVQNIVAVEREKLKSANKPPEQRKILQRTPSRDTLGRKITVIPGHQEVQIVSDIDPRKQLRTVPRG